MMDEWINECSNVWFKFSFVGCKTHVKRNPFTCKGAKSLYLLCGSCCLYLLDFFFCFFVFLDRLLAPNVKVTHRRHLHLKHCLQLKRPAWMHSVWLPTRKRRGRQRWGVGGVLGGELRVNNILLWTRVSTQLQGPEQRPWCDGCSWMVLMDADEKEKLQMIRAGSVFKDAHNCIGVATVVLFEPGLRVGRRQIDSGSCT